MGMHSVQDAATENL